MPVASQGCRSSVSVVLLFGRDARVSCADRRLCRESPAKKGNRRPG